LPKAALCGFFICITDINLLKYTCSEWERWRRVKGMVASYIVIYPVAELTVNPQGVAPPDLDSRCDIAKLKPTNYVLSEYL